MRLEAKKPTSVFTGEGSGIYLTQMAWAEGKPIKGNPNKKEHNFGVTTGFGPNGGAQKKVRVHRESKGKIHGHPSGKEYY